jgi:predicted enzyme related to lactoylglutathione lyase
MIKYEEPSERESGNVDNRLARHGHVSYLEIPATNIEKSASFFEAVFGWAIDRRDDGRASFDDRSGDLIGRWVTGHAPSREPGLLPFIYVDGIDAIVEQIPKRGGVIVEPPYPEGDLWVATFRDPAGNLMGVWQAGPR